MVDAAVDHVYMKHYASLVPMMKKHEIPTSDIACLHFNPGSVPVNSAWFGKIVKCDHEACELTLITEFGSFKQAQSVAATQSGLIAVVDYESKEVMVYRDENGEYKRQFCLGGSSDDPNGRLLNPFNIAVTSEDKFLVIDDGSGKVFSSTGQYEQTLPIDLTT